MIVVRVVDGRQLPIAACDVCRALINDPRTAVVVADTEEGDHPPHVVHRGACQELLEAALRLEGVTARAESLSSWAVRLLRNLGLRDEALDRALALVEHVVRFAGELGLDAGVGS